MRKGAATPAWPVLGPALILPGIFAWCYFIAFGAKPEARVWYAAAKGFLLLWPLVCRIVGLRGDQTAGWRERRTGRSVIAGLGLGCLVLLLMAVAWQTPLGAGLRDGAEPIRAKLAQFGVTTHNYLAMALTFSLVHSALEEYYWRWFVFGQLRTRLPGWTAHLLAAAGFALHHYVALSVYFGVGTALWMGTAVAAGGLLWSAMYERWRTLAGPWFSHLIVDLGMFWFGYLLLKG